MEVELTPSSSLENLHKPALARQCARVVRAKVEIPEKLFVFEDLLKPTCVPLSDPELDMKRKKKSSYEEDPSIFTLAPIPEED